MWTLRWHILCLNYAFKDTIFARSSALEENL